MIEINLLPPEHRPVERTPVPRLLTILAGVLLTTVGVVMWTFLNFVFIPNAKNKLEEAKHTEATKRAEREQVEKLQARLRVFSAREEILRKLYNQRIRWTRVLDRLAEARKSANVVLTRIDLRRGAGGGAKGKEPTKQLVLEGYVPGFGEDPVPADLMKPYRAMVSALCDDKKWQTMFELEPEYKGVEMIKLAAGGGGKAKDKDKDAKKMLPKAGLKFTVIFTFKSTAPPPKTSPVLGPPAATAAVAR